MSTNSRVRLMHSVLKMPRVSADNFLDPTYVNIPGSWYRPVAAYTETVDAGLSAAVHYSCLHFVEKLNDRGGYLQ